MTCPICGHPGSKDAASCNYQYRHPKPPAPKGKPCCHCHGTGFQSFPGYSTREVCVCGGKITNPAPNNLEGWIVVVGYPRNSLAGEYLEGPRTPKHVKSLGYGFTTDIQKAWTFPSEKQAAAKALIVDRHMGWGEGVMVAGPKANAQDQPPQVG